MASSSPSLVSTARALQRMLEAEGAVFHREMAPTPMPSMGGGMGVVVTAAHGLQPSTRLATLPFRSMVTAKKARVNLAMAEVAITEATRAASPPPHAPFVAPFLIPFTARVWESEDMTELESTWGRQRYQAVRLKEEELERKLSPTDTIVCYLLLLARLYGRWDLHTPDSAARPNDDDAGDASPSLAPVSIRFTHENAWMRLWLTVLPAQYDNLLELQPSCEVPARDSPEAHVERDEQTSAVASACFLTRYTPFARQVEKVQREHASLLARLTYCRGVVSFLSRPLIGVDAAATSPTPPSCLSHSVSLAQFRWAFNTLMSRGFAFEEDVWAMMPWVDYFNYALLANGTMQWTCTAAVAPTRGASRRTRGQPHTVSKWSRVCAPNAYEYTFELVEPVKAGSQVFLHYGAYSDFELLQWYGFRLGGFLLPTSLMAKAAPPCSALHQDALNATSILFNPLLHPWMEAEEAINTPPNVQIAVDEESQRPSLPTTNTVPAAVRTLFTDAARRQTIMSRFLPVLVRSETRADAFRVFWDAKEEQRSADVIAMCEAHASAFSAETQDELRCDEEADESREARRVLAYESWCQSVQRACSYATSPYADTDGNYPPQPAPGCTWLHQLFAAFSATPIATTSAASAFSGASASAQQTDTWARTLSHELPTVIGADAEVLDGLRKNCYLGPLGRSQALATALDRLTQLLFLHQPQSRALLPEDLTHQAPRVQKAHLQRQLVRAIAWAELYTNWTLQHEQPQETPDTADAATLPSFLSCVSRAAAAMTFEGSCDAWTLLHFLALEASDEMLDEYVTYEDAYYG